MVNETRKSSLEKLTFFIKNGLNNYSSKRNFDFGPDKRSNVSNLSPYIRKRISDNRKKMLAAANK